jgi:hypothetical protein
VLQRLLDNRTRPCLLCCDQMALELMAPPLPPTAATATAAPTAAADAGSLFSLLFRAASFPPTFIASVRTMLPVPLQRLLRTVPPQHLPAFFRARAVQSAPQQQQPQMGGVASVAAGGVEYLELSLYEYYFVSCASFLLQPDLQVQPQSLTTVGPAGAASRPVDPPTPEQYTSSFLRLLTQYLEFLVPARGVHSSSLRLEENGWNPAALLSHGASLVEVLAEVLMGQFSYEAAQQNTDGLMHASAAAAQPFGLNQPGGMAMAGTPRPYLPPDEFTLPSAKVINAIMRLVYHLLEQSYMESPASSVAVQAVTATRASIVEWQKEKHARHAESLLVRLRVDWHLFGVLQHCFHRWAGEWSTTVGVQPVMLISAAAAAAPSGQVSSYSSAPARTEDRLTKLVELWLDYLEPWKSIYNEEFNPLIWRWWIVANLPFYTVLLRDFLRLLLRLDLGREQSPQRTAHLKTFLHLLKIFEGPVLEHVEDVETLLVRHASGQAQQHYRDAQPSPQSQQEAFVVRNAMLHLGGQRPETYVPVFAPAAAVCKTTATTGAAGGAFSFASPGGAGMHLASPQRFDPRFGSFSAANTPRGTQPGKVDGKARLIESQQVSMQLIRAYSIGYQNVSAISSQRETELLNAPSVSPAALAASNAQRGGAAPPVQGISLLTQEEQLGQHIEKRLRAIFKLPEAPAAADDSMRVRSGLSTPGGRNNNVDAAGAGTLGGAPAVAPPRSLRDLEPERASGDPYLRLTEAGRAQIRAGLRLCSKFDVPVVGDGLYPHSYEIEPLVAWSSRVSQQLNARWGLPTRKGGFQINLRFLANQYVFYTMMGMLALLLLIIYCRI